jgi:crotonobetainyl-CoA:carnitine CoA-transferase CaiB-like acyl-CoA transferase|tara:strand:- start:870 stop:2078 length:1209 start_codon:yes stop_codon:yes gene_type:complete
MDILTDIRVLSFNHFLLGPMGTQVLADLGADVISIEPVGGAFQRHWGGANHKVDGESMLHLCGNRNKKNLAIDIKDPAGHEIVQKLLETADILSENFRPGVMEKLGFGYETVKQINPKIIYASASGFGQDGPYSKRPGQDLVIQALSGLANLNGNKDQPPIPVGVSAADHHGAQILAMSILAALYRREKTGKGTKVEVDLLSAALDLQNESLVCYLNGANHNQRPPKNIAGWYFPGPYGIYKATDGHIAISLGPMPSLAKALNTPELAGFGESETFSRKEEIADLVQSAISNLDLASVEEKLEGERLWYSRVNDYAAVLEDPQVQHNGSFPEITTDLGSTLRLVAHPAKYDGVRPEVRLPPQPLGAQTAEILDELGYNQKQILDLAERGVVHLVNIPENPGK